MFKLSTTRLGLFVWQAIIALSSWIPGAPLRIATRRFRQGRAAPARIVSPSTPGSRAGASRRRRVAGWRKRRRSSGLHVAQSSAPGLREPRAVRSVPLRAEVQAFNPYLLCSTVHVAHAHRVRDATAGASDESSLPRAHAAQHPQERRWRFAASITETQFLRAGVGHGRGLPIAVNLVPVPRFLSGSDGDGVDLEAAASRHGIITRPHERAGDNEAR